jgi:hypothetical protein
MPLEEGSRFGKNTARLLFELRLQLRHDVETKFADNLFTVMYSFKIAESSDQ